METFTGSDGQKHTVTRCTVCGLIIACTTCGQVQDEYASRRKCRQCRVTADTLERELARRGE